MFLGGDPRQKHSGMTQQGFFLLEMLAALLLVSLAAGGLAVGFVQILKCQKRIEGSFKNDDQLRILSLRLEKDARNAVYAAGHPFRGKKQEISFPAFENVASAPKLVMVRYFFKDHELIRSIRELSPKLEKPEAVERIVLKNIRTLEFKFPYLGKEDEIAYESFWPEEPYYGVPRVIRLDLMPDDGGRPLFSKLISIPQGKWGHLQILEKA